jgi:hypothetical protein
MPPLIDTAHTPNHSTDVAGATTTREPKITNPGGRYHRASLIEPSQSGYVHIAAQIDPPTRPGPAPATRARNEALARLSRERARLAQQHPDWSVELFRAVGFPPLDSLPIPERYRSAAAFYDVIVLVKTTTTAELPSLSEDAAYQAMLDVLEQRARSVTITQARNARRIADVPPEHKLHLFNHFLAEDAGALDVWDYVAGWYEQEMRLKNSEVLAPIDPHSTPFAFINHASWNMTLARFITRQLTRPSFRTFVLANLRDNDIGSLPYLYRHLPGESRWITNNSG